MPAVFSCERLNCTDATDACGASMEEISRNA
jgi:hypothetical protein